MTTCEQIEAFGHDLDKLIERYGDEFDLPYAAIVGVLYMKAHMLCQEVVELDEELDEEGGAE